jgi:AcrR family transcriptional regulator
MEHATIRQKEIIAAAMGVIGERGLEGLTMKNIAARVGFSDAALYRHFKDKSYVLSAMVDSFADASLSELRRIGAAGGSGLEQIRRFYSARCRSFAADRAQAAVMFAEGLFRSDPHLSARIQHVMDDHRRLLLRSIRLGQRQGVLKPLPPEHIFTIIMGSLRLLVLQWQVNGDGFELPAAGAKLWHSLETLIANKKGA